VATIKIRENGPYLVSGDDVTMVDWNGRPYQLPIGSFVLCRCGASAVKPFCDKSHRRVGFVGAEAPANPSRHE
jgi:3-phenylpropionate/trans-cinnamate dioxygenase ferredoxin subunit